MANAIASLYAALGLQSQAFTRGMKGVVTELQAFQSRIAGIQRSLIGLAGAGGLALIAKNALESADNLGDMAARLGISAQSLAAFQYAAKQSGSSVETLNRSIGLMLKNVESNGKTTEQLFLSFADKIAAIKDPAERAKLAMETFGKSGIELINTLQLGSKGLEEIKTQAQSLGIALSDSTIQAMGEANDAIGTLGTAAKGLAQTIVGVLSPSITSAANNLTAMLTGLINTNKETIAGAIAWARLAVEIAIAAKVVGAVSAAIRTLIVTVEALKVSATGGLSKLFEGLIKVAGVFLVKVAAVIGVTALLETGFEGLTQAAEQTQSTVPALTSALEETGSAAAETGKQIDTLIEGLKTQSRTFGLTAAEADVYRLKVMGATEAQIKLADRLARGIDSNRSYEKIKQTVSDLKDEIFALQHGADALTLRRIDDLGGGPSGLTDVVRGLLEQKRALEAQKEAVAEVANVASAATDGMAASMERLSREMEDFTTITSSGQDALGEFMADAAKLQAMFAQGLINKDALRASIEKLKASALSQSTGETGTFGLMEVNRATLRGLNSGQGIFGRPKLTLENINKAMLDRLVSIDGKLSPLSQLSN